MLRSRAGIVRGSRADSDPKEATMGRRHVLAVLSLCCLFGTAMVASSRVMARGAAADPCASLNAGSINGYRDLIQQALSAASSDARANGTRGTYAVAATNSRDLLQRAFDRAQQMVTFNNTQVNKDPNSTTYVEAGNIKAYLQTILKWLPDAAHWATISAAYHRSQYAITAFKLTIEAMTKGSDLMGAAGLCFTAPYMAGTVKAG
jgi:hypothetical protein